MSKQRTAAIDLTGAFTKSLVEGLDKSETQCARLRAEKEELKQALADVRELIYGYADAEDGDYGQPEGNKAMRAVQRIDEVL